MKKLRDIMNSKEVGKIFYKENIDPIVAGRIQAKIILIIKKEAKDGLYLE